MGGVTAAGVQAPEIDGQMPRHRHDRAWKLDPPPELLPRDPPIRFRRNVPDCWIALELTEGRNRQVRRMTATVGHPTLRLIRVRVASVELSSLAPGSWREITAPERRGLFS